MNEEDPRATQVHSNQQQQISEVLRQLEKSMHVNAFFVLTNFLDCPEIKNEPEFFQILFDRNLDVVIELVDWMLIPKELIKKKKIKVNVDSYPYQCRELLKDNWCFYEQLYIALRKKKLDFGLFLKFLRKQYYDKNTIYTALGYFADVMIPFAKYEFSGSFNLIKSLEFSTDKFETFGILRVLNEAILDELVGYSFHEPIFQLLKNVILVSLDDSTQINFARNLLAQLLDSCEVVNIFGKFSESPNPQLNTGDQLTRYLDLFESLSSFLREIVQNMQPTGQPTRINFHLIDIIVESKIIDYFQRELLQSRLCGGVSSVNSVKLYSSARIRVDLGKPSVDEDPEDRDGLTFSSQGMKDSRVTVTAGGITLDVEEHEIAEVMIKVLTTLVDIYEQMPKCFPTKVSPEPGTPVTDSFQLTFTSVSQSVSAQKFISPSSPQVIPKSPQIVSPASLSSPKSPMSPKKLKKSHQQVTLQQYTTTLLLFHEQVQNVMDNLDKMTRFVINYIGSEEERPSTVNFCSGLNRILPFSSGENVRCISFMKYEVFKLLYSCLMAWQDSQDGEEPKQSTPNKDVKLSQKTSTSESPSKKEGEIVMVIEEDKGDKGVKEEEFQEISLAPFKLCMQKLHIIEIVKKYLTENRWNNIAQGILIQVCHLLIMNCYGYIKKNIEKDKFKKFSDSFLSYLIQNFTKRDFIFLNTVKFTTQGNLYALYIISKDLAYSLNSTNELVIFLNEFEPWKKFIMNDLKNYEEKLFPFALKPEFDDEAEDQSLKVKVDEADSIKKLVENISGARKWPVGALRSRVTLKKSHRSSFDIKNQRDPSETSPYLNKRAKPRPELQFDKYLQQSNKIDKLEEFALDQQPVLQRNISKQNEKDKDKDGRISKKFSLAHPRTKEDDHR